MKLATWNINSLKVRLAHVLEWLAAHDPDVLCLQETKLADEFFTQDELRQRGYHLAFSGQKTYNGVAIISKTPLADIECGIRGFSDEQKRVIAATTADTRIVCVYVPNGQSVGSDKYQYKLRWLDALIEWLADELKRYPRLALLGDYNIAPADADVHDPALWVGCVQVSEPERAAFARLIGLGLHDSFRLFEQAAGTFSWWDYRAGAFRRNMGLRIDHVLLSEELARNCISSAIDKVPRKLERPSDHAPVIVEIKSC